MVTMVELIGKDLANIALDCQTKFEHEMNTTDGEFYI